MLQRGSAFKGYTIEATDGKVGTISDLLFDDQKWQLRWLVVDTGNWLNGRKVLIHPAALERPDSAGRAFVSKLTRAQLEASPAIDTDAPVAMQMERNMGGYYGWSATYYDNGIAASPVLPMPPHGAEPRTEPRTEPGDAGPGPIDRHLRSIAEVSRYAIHALDGNVGHFETFLVDDESWAIRYLVIDTMDWWMGKHVLVSPSSVTNIDWAQRQISLDLTCYKIKGSPAWDDTGPIDRVYEQVLRLYYGWGALGDDTGAVTHVPVAAA